MDSTINASRAVSSEFASRILKPLQLGGVIGCIVLLSVGGYLISISAWWWLLQISIIIFSLLIAFAIVISRFVLRALTPTLTKVQKKGTRQFVDKMQRVSDSIGTPKLIILFRIVRDSLQKRENGFIQTISNDTSSLSGDFVKLRRLFEQ